MIFALLTLLAALGLAAVAGWFSIIGIMSIYAGAAMHALVMGIALEAGKLVTTSWLYRNWEYSDWKLKTPLIIFTLTLMLATSIGVFGFLSKAHLEQGAGTIDNSAKVERLDQQIAREKATIDDDQKVTQQLDATINSYLGKDRTDRSLAVRKSQAPQRKQLRDDIDAAQKRIDGYSDEKLKLNSQLRQQQLDVGPIRYIAELWYGTDGNADKNIESAVRIFTLIIVSSLDPLAVILLIAANHTLLRRQREKEEKARASEQNRLIIRKDESADSNDQVKSQETQDRFDYPKEDVPEIDSTLHDTIHVAEDETLPTEVLPEIRADLNEEKAHVTESDSLDTSKPSFELAGTISEETLFGSSENRQDERRQFRPEQATASTLPIQARAEVQEINEEDKSSVQETDSNDSERSEDTGMAISGLLYPKGPIKEDAPEITTHLFPMGDDRAQEILEVQEVNEEAPTFDELHRANAESEGMFWRAPAYHDEIKIDQIDNLESESGQTSTNMETDSTIQEEMEVGLNEEETTTLAELRSLLDVQAPIPIIRSPSPSRLERSDVSSTYKDQETTIEVAPWQKSKVNTPWTANQSMLAELIGSRPHFIPQKINEENKPASLETSTTETTSWSEENDSPTAIEEVQTVQLEGPDQAQEDKTVQRQTPVVFLDIAEAETDKYPKALSWLNEFKRT